MEDFVKIILSSPEVSEKADAQKVCDIAKRVLETCRSERCDSSPAPPDASDVLRRMTGMKKEVCELFIKLNSPFKTFSDWYRRYDLENIDRYDESNHNDVIRSVVVHHYLHLHVIPTVKSLQTHLQETCGSTYSVELLDELLKMNGYHWRSLHKTSKAILLEDAKKAYKRRKYLDTIMRLRQNKRHFVYIDDTIIKTDQSYIDTDAGRPKMEDLYCYAAVSPSLGLLNSACIPIKSKMPCTEEQLPTESFIVDKVLAEIPPSSVIVVPERSYHEKPLLTLPDINSSKKEMSDWLDYHNVPYDEKMHAAELYELVKRSQRNFEPEVRKFDKMLSMYGHTVLRLPRNTTYLYYFEPFWSDFFKRNIEPTNTIDGWELLIRDALQRCNDMWAGMENDLISKEIKISTEDEAVEDITDRMRTMARDDMFLEKDWEYCEEVEEEDWLREVIIP